MLSFWGFIPFWSHSCWWPVQDYQWRSGSLFLLSPHLHGLIWWTTSGWGNRDKNSTLEMHFLVKWGATCLFYFLFYFFMWGDMQQPSTMEWEQFIGNILITQYIWSLAYFFFNRTSDWGFIRKKKSNVLIIKPNFNSDTALLAL